MCASRPSPWLARGLAALLCGAVVTGTLAQQQPSREQEQLRRLRLQVQELQKDQATQRESVQRADAEKAASAAQLQKTTDQVATLQGELRRGRTASAAQTLALDAAQKQLDAERQERAALQARLDRSQTELQANARSIERQRIDAAELQRRLGTGETALASLSARHSVQATGLQTCIANNQTLRDIGLDMLQRYATKTVADVLAQNEPFLQVRRVAMENLVQGYEDKLDAQALKPAPGTVLKVEQPPAVQGPQRAP